MNSSKINEEKIKEEVKSAYGKLVSGPKLNSCCGPSASSCCGPSINESKGNVVKVAGYEKDHLKNLPKESVENSFGCGNPLAFSEVKQGQVVVDIGSGAGIDCFIASEKVGEEGKVIGIDMTPEMIAKANENAKAGGFTNVEFRMGDAEAMPVEDSSIDWVISNCVINLSPNKPKVFAEIGRVLKPGGQISISDIVLGDDLPQEIIENIPAWTGCVAGAVKESEYLTGLKNAGLSEVSVDSRITYSVNQIKELVDVNAFELAPEKVEEILRGIEGKIWSAKIIGLK